MAFNQDLVHIHAFTKSQWLVHWTVQSKYNHQSECFQSSIVLYRAKLEYFPSHGTQLLLTMGNHSHNVIR